jgi:hypothetical protein
MSLLFLKADKAHEIEYLESESGKWTKSDQ